MLLSFCDKTQAGDGSSVEDSAVFAETYVNMGRSGWTSLLTGSMWEQAGKGHSKSTGKCRVACSLL